MRVGPQLRGSGGARHWQRPAHGLLGGRADHAPGGAHGAAGHAGHHPAHGRRPCGWWRAWCRSRPGAGAGEGAGEPVEVFELVGRQCHPPALAGGGRAGPHAALWGGQRSWRRCTRPWHGRGPGTARWSPWWGRRAWASPAWSMSCVHSHRTQGWRVLESASVSYGKATPYFPVMDLLKRYCHVEDGDDARTIRAKVTGQVLTLDETLQDTLPALLALLDALPDDSPFLQPRPAAAPPAHARRRSSACCCAKARCSRCCWSLRTCTGSTAETQALLDSLVESLPTARLLLLVNYRPEYQHGWGSKTYYTQLRLDPLPPASADEFLQALLGDDSEPGTAQAAPDCAHRGQSLLSGGERAHPGGDRGAGGRAGGLSAGAGPADDSGAGHGAGGAGGAHRPAAAGGEAPPPDRRRHWHGRALRPAAGHCRAARGGAAPRPGAPPGGRVPLRDAPVPRARVHLQACPDARGGLRQPPAGAAAGAARPHRRGP